MNMSIEHFMQFSRFIFAGNEGFRRMAYRKKMYLKVNFSSFTLQDKGGGADSSLQTRTGN